MGQPCPPLLSAGAPERPFATTKYGSDPLWFRYQESPSWEIIPRRVSEQALVFSAELRGAFISNCERNA